MFLCNVAQFTASEARVLDAYLGHGGNLVFFLGDQVLADRYNRELGGGSRAARASFPARLGASSSTRHRASTRWAIATRSSAPFAGEAKSGLLTTPIGKHYQLELSPRTRRPTSCWPRRTAIRWSSSSRSAKGRVVLVATSADLSWTAMPLWPSYVPLVQEILAWCVGGKLQRRNLEVGQPLRGVRAGGGRRGRRFG